MYRRLLLTVFAVFGSFYAVNYAADQCALVENADTTKCVAFNSVYYPTRSVINYQAEKLHIKEYYNKLKTQTSDVFGPTVKVISEHPVTVKGKKFADDHVAPKVKQYAADAKQWASDKGLPLAKRTAVQAYGFSTEKIKTGSLQAYEYSKTHVWPVVRHWAITLKNIVFQWLQSLWRHVESSQIWKDVFLAQVQKIRQSMENKSSVASSASSLVSSTASDVSNAATNAASKASGSVSNAKSAAGSVASSVAKEVEQDTVYETIVYTSTVSSVSTTTESKTVSHPETTMYISSKGVEGLDIAKVNEEINAATEDALKQLVIDAEALFKRKTEEAQPEIMKILRELQNYSSRAVRKMTKLATSLESGDAKSKRISRDDVYPVHEKAVTQIANIAVQVRNRSEALANEVLEQLPEVRQGVIDVLDDFFGYTLENLQKQMTNAKFDQWRQFNSIKESMRQARTKVEDFDFDLDIVNTALKESQSAAVLLAEDHIQQLANMRARCQLVFQAQDINEEGAKSDSAAEEKINAHKTEMKWKPASPAPAEHTEPVEETVSEPEEVVENTDTQVSEPTEEVVDEPEDAHVGEMANEYVADPTEEVQGTDSNDEVVFGSEDEHVEEANEQINIEPDHVYVHEPDHVQQPDAEPIQEQRDADVDPEINVNSEEYYPPHADKNQDGSKAKAEAGAKAADAEPLETPENDVDWEAHDA